VGWDQSFNEALGDAEIISYKGMAAPEPVIKRFNSQRRGGIKFKMKYNGGENARSGKSSTTLRHRRKSGVPNTSVGNGDGCENIQVSTETLASNTLGYEEPLKFDKAGEKTAAEKFGYNMSYNEITGTITGMNGIQPMEAYSFGGPIAASAVFEGDTMLTTAEGDDGEIVRVVGRPDLEPVHSYIARSFGESTGVEPELHGTIVDMSNSVLSPEWCSTQKFFESVGEEKPEENKDYASSGLHAGPTVTIIPMMPRFLRRLLAVRNFPKFRYASMIRLKALSGLYQFSHITIVRKTCEALLRRFPRGRITTGMVKNELRKLVHVTENISAEELKTKLLALLKAENRGDIQLRADEAVAQQYGIALHEYLEHVDVLEAYINQKFQGTLEERASLLRLLDL
jgi:hypothetical protein